MVLEVKHEVYYSHRHLPSFKNKTYFQKLMTSMESSTSYYLSNKIIEDFRKPLMVIKTKDEAIYG